MGRSRRDVQAGLTLIEIMISIALLALMMTVAWSTVVSTSDAKRIVEKSQERSHEIRVGMARMVKDISMAYLSANEDQSVIDDNRRRTLFVGKSSGNVDELRFSSFAHEPMWADADECEQTLISYLSATDRKDGRKTNLIRRETRRLTDQSNQGAQQVPAEHDILIRDIERVKFEYWNWRDKEWQDTWNSTAADQQRGRLPTRVRITVEVKVDKDRTRKYMTQARLAMQEELRFVAPAQ